MSNRTEILDILKRDLNYILKGNGYANSVKRVYEGYIPLGSEQNYDTIFYFFGDDDPNNFTNDNKPQTFALDVYLTVQVKAESGEGKLTRKIESWVEDLRKWLGITDRTGITASKWLTIGTELDTTTAVIWGSVTPGKMTGKAIWEQNIAEFTIPIKLIYNN